jgi:hypothetical protein
MELNVELPENSHFSKDQKQALIKLEAFVNSKDMICTLSGPAGSGKTYLLNYFLHKVFRKASCVSAPTHKAVRIIEKMTKKSAMTLHSLHGLRPNVDIANFNISNPQFDPLAEPKIGEYKLVVIDECSQINSSIARLNEDRAAIYETKILYVGDELQLPPIKERISPTFTHKNVIRLNTIIRQDIDNPLLPLFTILRNDIRYQRGNFIKALSENYININKKREGYVILNTDDFNELLERKFKEDRLGNRFLGWKNEVVSTTNYDIRKMLNNTNVIITIDDVFTAYNTILDENMNPIITNSIDYKVKSVDNIINEQGLDVFVVTFISEFDVESTPVQIINHRSNTFTNYINILDNLHSLAYHATYGNRKARWAEYFRFKSSILSMIDIHIESSKYPITKDISYAYGLTIHKSQGSTYKNVFLDIKDLLYYSNGNPVKNSTWNPHAIEHRNKLLYVAFSRASKTVYIKS